MHRISLDTPTSAQLETQPAVPIDETTQSEDNQISAKPLLHRVSVETTPTMKQNSLRSFIILAVVAILAGVGTGFGSYKLSARQTASAPTEVTAQPTADSAKKGDIFGSSDTDTFKDTATGYLEAGGIDGEGSHKLIRAGGVSQTVYLTSSVTDLNELVGMDVKVWGETYKGQKAGWLMDVGRIEVLDTKGTKPTED